MSERSHDRRRTPRHAGPEAHGIVSARVRPGHDVVVIDISAGGALVESAHRLLPGAKVELRLATADGHAAVRGRVLRCSIARLDSESVCYRGAIGFDVCLPWFAAERDGGYRVHRCESRSMHSGRAEATPNIS